jgi:hypothetical protein
LYGYRGAVAGNPVRRSAAVVLLVPVLAVLALTGCSKAASKQAAPAPSTSTSSAPATSESATSTAPASPTASPTLGGQCDDLLPPSTVDEALGRPVIGKTAFIRGIAEPNIGRLTYLNCKYGIPAAVKGKPAPVAQLEIGVSLYGTVAQAARRVQGTIDNYRSQGSSQRSVPVGTDSGTILVGYGNPTIVVASGPRTVAITIDPRLVSAAPTSALTALAQAVLVATSSFDGVAGVTATPSPTGSPTDSSSPTSGASPSGTAS